MRMVSGRIMIARARGAFSAPSSELRISARTPSIRASMPATYPSRHARVERAFKTSICTQVAFKMNVASIQSDDDLERQRLCANAKPCATQQQQFCAATPSQQQR